MSEEDTFLKLAKPPYEVIYSMVNDIPDDKWHSMTDAEIDCMFAGWYWTYKEYANETIRRISTKWV